MAKTVRAKKIEEQPPVAIMEEILPEEPIEEDFPEEEPVSEVTMVEEPAPVPPKMVRIRVRENHSCHIGVVDYHLEKDGVYNVPENVKNILLKAGLLNPL